jgi:hypothetical protein
MATSDSALMLSSRDEDSPCEIEGWFFPYGNVFYEIAKRGVICFLVVLFALLSAFLPLFPTSCLFLISPLTLLHHYFARNG